MRKSMDSRLAIIVAATAVLVLVCFVSRGLRRGRGGKSNRQPGPAGQAAAQGGAGGLPLSVCRPDGSDAGDE